MKNLAASVVLLSASIFASSTFAQSEGRMTRVTIEDCNVGSHSVDGEPLGEFFVSLDIDVTSQKGTGKLSIVDSIGAKTDFAMQCQPMTDAIAKNPGTDRTYLVHGSFNEFLICDTVDAVRRELRYGVPFHMINGSPKLDTYTAFGDGQGASALILQACRSATSVSK